MGLLFVARVWDDIEARWEKEGGSLDIDCKSKAARGQGRDLSTFEEQTSGMNFDD